MPDIWLISDTHFGHKNILSFMYGDKPLRPFHNTYEMDGVMMERWAEVVKPQDKIYHLGDVAFTQNGLLNVRSLPGHKRLVKGNHDKMKLRMYTDVFEDIYGVRQIDGFWFTHVPMHEGSMFRAKMNVHGHLHAGVVLAPDSRPDKRYFNVSVERIDYRPINFDEVKAYYEKNR